MAEWKRDWQSYSHDLQFEHIHAHVYISKKRDEHDGRRYKDVICARVGEFGGGNLRIEQSGFDDIESAQKWCEEWIAYMRENKTLKDEVARLKDWLRYRNERIDELQAKLQEIELEKIRAQFATKGE